MRQGSVNHFGFNVAAAPMWQCYPYCPGGTYEGRPVEVFFAIFLRPTEQICPDSAGPFISFDPVGFAIFASIKWPAPGSVDSILS